jgi:hypothetical protein
MFHDFGNFARPQSRCTLPLSLDIPVIGEARTGRKVLLRVAADAERFMAEMQANPMQYEEMQSAPRFPLHLTASVKTQGSAYAAETENISANGVLLAMENDVPVGSMVDFTILLPADVLGARQNVQIDCRGRVVRSFEDRGRRAVGVVIDEYHFERA